MALLLQVFLFVTLVNAWPSMTWISSSTIKMDSVASSCFIYPCTSIYQATPLDKYNNDDGIDFPRPCLPFHLLFFFVQ